MIKTISKYGGLVFLVLVLVASFFALAPPKPVEAHSPLYWYGGSGNWSSGTSHWSTNSGNSPASTHASPTSTDSVIFDALSDVGGAAFTVTVDSTSNCHDFTNTAVDVVMTLAGSSALNINGSLTLKSTTTRTYTGNVNFTSTGAGETITMNAIQWSSASIAFNGAGGEWILQDAFTNANIGGVLDVTNGRLNTNGQAVSVGYLACTAGGTNDIHLGASTVTLTQGTGSFGWDATNLDALDAGTSTINIPNLMKFIGNGLTYYAVSGVGAHGTWSGNNSYTNLTFSNTAKDDIVYLGGNATVSGTFTATGVSSTNRLLIRSSSGGVQRTITAATVVSAHADYWDIVGAGAGDWDISSGGEDSVGWPNCSGLTFTWPYDTTRNMYWTGLQDGVAGSGNWQDYYNWSSTSGGAGGAPRLPNPTSTNNVYFDANSGFTVGNTLVDLYMGGTIQWKDMSFTGSGAIAIPQLTWSVNGGVQDAYCYGSITLIAGQTNIFGHTGSAPGRLNLMGSGTITTNGAQFGFYAIVLNTTGTYTFGDDIVVIPTYDDFYSYTWTAGTLDFAGNYLHLYGGSSTPLFNGGGKTFYGDVRLYGDGIWTIAGQNNFTDLTRVSTATYTDGLKFGADQYIGNLTLTGFDTSRRLAFASSVAGTQRQISVSGTVNVTNTNISDSAKVGAGDPDITAGNNSDFGGNLGWIFDTGYYIYWVGNSGNWSDRTNHWSSTSGGTPGTGRVPLIQDIAVFDANSFTIPGRTVTIDITDISGIDSSTVTNTPTISKAGTIDIYGDCNFGTWTYSVTTTNFKGLDATLESDSTMTTAFYVLKNEGFMSTLYLNSNVTVAGTVYVQSGVFNHGGFNLTAQYYDSATTTYNRQILLGSGVMTLDGTGAVTKLSMNATKLTLTAGESTIILTNSGASGQTFAPASLTYNNITIAGAGAYTLTINSVFTCGTLTIDRSQANKTIAGNYAITIGDGSGLILATSTTKTITITNTDFTMASGVVFGDYLVISGSAAGGGGTFFANVGGHSTDSGGNSGWVWTAPTAPTISTLTATDVTYLGERLNGELLTKGSYVTFYCYFEYGPTVSYGFTTPETTKTAVGTFNQYLSPYKVYHYRAVVRFGLNDHAYGNDKTVSIAGAVSQAQAAISDPGQAAGVGLVGVGDVPAQPARMYAEGNTGGIPIAPAINDALAVTSTPEAVFWYPIAFFIALIFGFGAFGMTRSLLIQAIVSGCVMAAFAGGGVLGDGLIPYWTVIVFLIEGILVWLIQEKQNI